MTRLSYKGGQAFVGNKHVTLSGLLRFKRKHFEQERERAARPKLILQQQWQSVNGEKYWFDVETVEEDAPDIGDKDD